MGWVSPLCLVGSGLRGWALLLNSGPPRAARHRRPMAVPPSPGAPPPTIPPPKEGSPSWTIHESYLLSDSLSLTSSSADQAHTLQNSALVSPSLGNILSSFDTVSCSYLALCTDFLCLRKRHHGQKLRLSNHSKGLSPNSIIY